MVPIWRKDIEVPKIAQFQQKIEDKVESIKVIQQEISRIRSQMQEWESYRDLLTKTGEELVNIVQKALSDIGIKVKKTEEGFPADLIGNRIAVEITGSKGHVKVSSGKVIQTSWFKENHHRGEKIVFIANTFMDLPPQEREARDDFTTEAKKYFEASRICYLTTKTLFQLWKDVVTKKRDSRNVKKKILTEKGELTLNGF
jgi:hypothetical protein